MNEYIQKLKSPRWQKIRLKVFERDSWTCQLCGDKETTLHVHHLSYRKDTDPWDYPMSTFKTLCEICHEGEPSTFEETIGSLIHSIRIKGLLAVDVFPLVAGFKNMPILKDTLLQMKAISSMLNDKTLIKRWMKKELASMDKNNGKPPTG